MGKWTRIALAVCLVVVLATIAAAQVNSYLAGLTARDVIRSKDTELADKNEQLSIVRKTRDEAIARAREIGLEKNNINCAIFDVDNAFVVFIAKAFNDSPTLNQEQKAEVQKFLVPAPRPEACPPKENS